MKFLGIHIILNDTWEEYKETEEKAKKLAKEVENLDGRLLLALERGNKLNDKNNELEKEILDLGKSLSDVKKELTISRDSNKKLMSSVREKGDKIKDLEKEIKDLKEENKEREDYIGRLLERNKDLSGKVSSLNAAKGGYIKKIKDLANELDSLNASMKEKESEIDFVPDGATDEVSQEVPVDQVTAHYEATLVTEEAIVGETPVLDEAMPDKGDKIAYFACPSTTMEYKPSEVIHTPKNKKKKKNHR